MYKIFPAFDSREQWDSFRQIFNFIPASENHDLTDKQD